MGFDVNNGVDQVSEAEELYQQGLVLLGQEKYVEAIVYFNKSLEENPMFVNTYINLGVTYANMSDLDSAEENFRKALLVEKTNGLVYFHLGNLKFMKNEYTKGIEYYNKADASGFNDAQLYLNLGMVYEQLEKYNVALRNYSKGIVADPLRADIRLKKASLYIGLGRFEEALKTLDELSAYAPDLFEGYHLRFEIYCMLKRYKEAETLINEAVEMFPEDISLLYDKIKLCNIQGEYEKALNLIEEAEKMEGYEIEERNLLYERAKIYAQMENVDATIECLNKTIVLEDEYIDYEARYLLMNIYVSVQKFEAVIEQADQLVKSEETTAYKLAAMYYKPYSIDKLGREKEAKVLFREAARDFRSVTLKQPGNVDAYLFRVLCHKDLEEYNKAMELLNYILLLSPDSAEVHGIKAAIHRELGQDAEARAEEDIARKLNPSINLSTVQQ